MPPYPELDPFFLNYIIRRKSSLRQVLFPVFDTEQEQFDSYLSQFRKHLIIFLNCIKTKKENIRNCEFYNTRFLCYSVIVKGDQKRPRSKSFRRDPL